MCNNQKGVSLIITFFVMIIILAVVLSISALLYSEVKVIRNMSNSMVSIFAAESGIEKVLYYDRQVRLAFGGYFTPCLKDEDCSPGQVCDGSRGGCGTLVSRGLCLMLDANKNVYYYCQAKQLGSPNNNSGIYCDNPNPTPLVVGGCDANNCNNCQITFDTTIDDGTNSRKYSVTAKIYPSGNSSIFEIDSKGTYGDAQRQVQVSVTTTP